MQIHQLTYLTRIIRGLIEVSVAANEDKSGLELCRLYHEGHIVCKDIN